MSGVGSRATGQVGGWHRGRREATHPQRGQHCCGSVNGWGQWTGGSGGGNSSRGHSEGDTGSVLLPKSHCLPPSLFLKPPPDYGALHSFSACSGIKVTNSTCPVSLPPAHLCGALIHVPSHQGGAHHVPGFAQILCPLVVRD